MRWLPWSRSWPPGAATGQGSDDPDGATGRGAAECQPMVRFEGTIYLGTAYSSEQVTQVGMADDANCDDNGEDARGAFFPPNPRQVEVSAFEGIPTSEVIRVRQGDLLGVFVSENVTDDRAEQLVDKVATPSADRQIGTLDVGHCWIEPVTFDGARWALPRTEQFGLGDRLPAHWEGTGENGAAFRQPSPICRRRGCGPRLPSSGRTRREDQPGALRVTISSLLVSRRSAAAATSKADHPHRSAADAA